MYVWCPVWVRAATQSTRTRTNHQDERGEERADVWWAVPFLLGILWWALKTHVSLPFCFSSLSVGNSRGTLCGKTCREDRDDEWMGVSLARQPKAGGSVLVSPLFSLISLKPLLLSDSNAKHVRINAFGSDWQSPALQAASSAVLSFKRKEKWAPARKALFIEGGLQSWHTWLVSPKDFLLNLRD